MPAGRPKSEATRIKELESRIKHLENELARAIDVANVARERPMKMESLFFDISALARNVIDSYYAHPDEALLLAQIRGIECIADSGSNMYY